MTALVRGDGLGKVLADGRRLFAARSLSLAPGQALLLTGASGSGKTSLLTMVAGLDNAFEGTLLRFCQGVAVPGGEAALARWRGQQVGLLLQHGNLFSAMTVAQNVTCAGRCAGATAAPSCSQALQQLGLHDKAQQRAETLSGGEQRRLALARLLYRQPSLLLCDEPTAGLDAVWAERVGAALAEQVGRGAALLLATHEHSLLQRFAAHLTLGAEAP